MCICMWVRMWNGSSSMYFQYIVSSSFRSRGLSDFWFLHLNEKKKFEQSLFLPTIVGRFSVCLSVWLFALAIFLSRYYETFRVWVTRDSKYFHTSVTICRGTRENRSSNVQRHLLEIHIFVYRRIHLVRNFELIYY